MSNAIPFKSEDSRPMSERLSFASNKPAAKKKRHWSWYFFALGVFILIGAGLAVAQLLSGRIAQIHIRDACLNYVSPPRQVVFEEDPAALEQLASSGPGYERTIGGRLCQIPECWKQEAPNLNTSGTVFLHELTSPAGHKRLVSIDVNIGAGMWLSTTGHVEDVSLAATIIQPGRAIAHDKMLVTSQTSLWVCPADPKPTRFFGGSIDPNNPSHFVVEYERQKIHSAIDGRLNDDDTISLIPRLGTTSHAREPLMWEPDDDTSTPTK